MSAERISPLPWKIADLTAATVVDATGHTVAYCVSAFARENAAYIVRCVAATRMEEVFNRDNPIGLAHIAKVVHEWANKTFPDRTPGGMALKLYEEIGEWLREPKSRHEFADIMIMLLDAALVHGIEDIDRAILEKLAINRGRTWEVTAMGTLQHKGE